MDLKNIKKNLKNKMIGKSLLYYNEIDSTNEEAKAIASQDPPEGVVILAEKQTKGKGRLGRGWVSNTGESLTFSIVIRPHINPEKKFLLTLIGALSAVKGIHIQTGLPAKLKWPNDIVIGDKKIGGVLSEVSISKKGPDSIIVGIGLNVNNQRFPEEIAGFASSLFLESGKKVKREALFLSILQEFEHMYNLLLSGRIEELFAAWKASLDTLGRSVEAETNKEKIKGEAVDLGHNGELIIKTKNDTIYKLLYGQVKKLKY